MTYTKTILENAQCRLASCERQTRCLTLIDNLIRFQNTNDINGKYDSGIFLDRGTPVYRSWMAPHHS